MLTELSSVHRQTGTGTIVASSLVHTSEYGRRSRRHYRYSVHGRGLTLNIE